MSSIHETAINLLSEGTRIEGKLTVDQVARLHGTLVGDVESTPGSTLILGETGVIEGNVSADQVMVDGYVKGDIRASQKVVISGTGRVIGDVRTPSLQIEFGAHFEGRCLMEEARGEAGLPNPVTSGPELSPA
jgi:cytoskeletal protein CcmA (bactofilin family)